MLYDDLAKPLSPPYDGTLMVWTNPLSPSLSVIYLNVP